MDKNFDIQENDAVSEKLYSFAKDATEMILENKKKSIGISFVSDAKMQDLNQNFRGRDSTTDVLSFPFAAEEFEDKNFLGDIIISTEQAKKQALENGLSEEVEIRQLILHGILHLCGYDHDTDEGEMNSLELKFRDKLGINR